MRGVSHLEGQGCSGLTRKDRKGIPPRRHGAQVGMLVPLLAHFLIYNVDGGCDRIYHD